MRKILIIAAIISCFVFASVSSAQEGWRTFVPKAYVGVFGGWTYPDDLELEDAPDQELDGSWVLGAKVGGFFYANWLALELEYYHIGEMDFDNRSRADSVSADSIFVNAIVRYPHTRLHPFAGVGVGWAFSHLKNVQTGIGAIDSDDNNWAVQALAGVDYDLTEKWSLSAQYRYFYTEPEFVEGDDSKLKSHLFTIGVNYKF